MTTETQLSKIFSAAGPIISSHILEEGTSPQKRFTNLWIHKNGEVRFNGTDWFWKPNPPASNLFTNYYPHFHGTEGQPN